MFILSPYTLHITKMSLEKMTKTSVTDISPKPKMSLEKMTVPNLKLLAKERELKNYSKLRKKDLIALLSNSPKASNRSPIKPSSDNDIKKLMSLYKTTPRLIVKGNLTKKNLSNLWLPGDVVLLDSDLDHGVYDPKAAWENKPIIEEVTGTRPQYNMKLVVARKNGKTELWPTSKSFDGLYAWYRDVEPFWLDPMHKRVSAMEAFVAVYMTLRNAKVYKLVMLDDSYGLGPAEVVETPENLEWLSNIEMALNIRRQDHGFEVLPDYKS